MKLLCIIYSFILYSSREGGDFRFTEKTDEQLLFQISKYFSILEKVAYLEKRVLIDDKTKRILDDYYSEIQPINIHAGSLLTDWNMNID
jgi:hypothetical protein